MNLLSMSKEQLLTMLIARVIIILLILPLHEFAHAWSPVFAAMIPPIQGAD